MLKMVGLFFCLLIPIFLSISPSLQSSLYELHLNGTLFCNNTPLVADIEAHVDGKIIVLLNNKI